MKPGTMKRGGPFWRSIKSSRTAWICSFALLACGANDSSEETASKQPVSWEEFKRAATVHVGGREIYVVEWDLAVSLDELRVRYDAYVHNLRNADTDIGSVSQPSIVNRVNGADDVWHGQQMNLTYCVSNAFGGNKARAVSEMDLATAAWEAAARVNFTYVPAQDGNCNNTNTNVVFSVAPWGAGGACAFFPNQGPECELNGMCCIHRTLVMNFAAFDPPSPFTPNLTSLGVFRHELGHILGLRHEHTRPESGICFEDNDFRPLSSYDQDSVMHYPECNGVLATSWAITSLDAQGVRRLYGETGEKIWWHNGLNGQTQVWHMSGSNRTGAFGLHSSLDTPDSSGWRPVGMNDFNKDGRTDILWHNGTTGEIQAWYMDGTTRIGPDQFHSSLNTPASSGWRIEGTNDFNHDGNPDILWHNGSTGDTQVWYMDGIIRIDFGDLDNLLDLPDSSGWRIAGTNDFNQDGNPDILWHNGSTGGSQVWYMSGIARIGAEDFHSSLNVDDSTGWRIVGTNDLNRDGKADVLWHKTTGETQIWYMNGVVRTDFADFDASLNVPDSSGWRVINR
jgi:hypothetical protein